MSHQLYKNFSPYHRKHLALLGTYFLPNSIFDEIKSVLTVTPKHGRQAKILARAKSLRDSKDRGTGGMVLIVDIRTEHDLRFLEINTLA